MIVRTLILLALLMGSLDSQSKGGTLAQSTYRVYLPNSLRERVARRDLSPPGVGGSIILY